MTLRETHSALSWTADTIVFPFVGMLFILCGAAIGILGRVDFNGVEVTWEAEPLKFAAIVGASVAIGLICLAFSAVRLVLARRSTE